MLVPADYDDAALLDPLTRQLMEKIEFRHGGPEYDAKYPDGIPTTLEIDHAELGTLSSGLVMYPLGHARNDSRELDEVLESEVSHPSRALAVDDTGTLRRRFDRTRTEISRRIVRASRFFHPRRSTQ